MWLQDLGPRLFTNHNRLVAMKLVNAFALFADLRAAIQAAFFPTLRSLAKAPLLLLHPVDLSRLFMLHVWTSFGDSVDEGGREVKQELIPQAQGVVMDVGAGTPSLVVCTTMCLRAIRIWTHGPVS